MVIRSPIRSAIRGPLRGALESKWGSGNGLTVSAPSALSFAVGDQPIALYDYEAHNLLSYNEDFTNYTDNLATAFADQLWYRHNGEVIVTANTIEDASNDDAPDWLAQFTAALDLPTGEYYYFSFDVLKDAGYNAVAMFQIDGAQSSTQVWFDPADGGYEYWLGSCAPCFDFNVADNTTYWTLSFVMGPSTANPTLTIFPAWGANQTLSNGEAPAMDSYASNSAVETIQVDNPVIRFRSSPATYVSNAGLATEPTASYGDIQFTDAQYDSGADAYTVQLTISDGDMTVADGYETGGANALDYDAGDGTADSTFTIDSEELASINAALRGLSIDNASAGSPTITGTITHDATGRSTPFTISLTAFDENASVTPGVGAVTYTGLAPTAFSEITVTPGLAASSYTGYAPTATGGGSVDLPPYDTDLSYFIDIQQSDVTLSGSDVTAIEDLSGAGVTTANSGTGINLSPDGRGIRQNTSTSYLFTDGLSIDRQASSVFIVQRRTKVSTYSTNRAYIYAPYDGGSTNRFAMYTPNQAFSTFDTNQNASNIELGSHTPEVLWSLNGSSNQRMGVGEQSMLFGSAMPSGAADDLRLFLWSGTSFPLGAGCDIYAVLVYDRELSLSEAQEVLDWCAAQYDSPASDKDTVLIVDGDSLSQGVEASDVTDYAWQSQMAHLGSESIKVCSEPALGGKQLSSDPTGSAVQTQLTNFSGFTNRLALCWLGTNDINAGRSEAQLEGDIDNWISSISTADSGAILIGCTILPRGDYSAGEEIIRLAVNDHILNTAAFDLTVDLASVSELSDETNTTYFDGDQVHLTDAGYGVVAATIRAALVTAGYLAS